MKIKKDDNVKVISGKHAGSTGKVIQVLPKDNQVVIDGVNKTIKHIKSQKQGEKGQRFEFFAPLDASNVMVLDSKTNKPTRIGYKKLDNGQKVRIAKKSGEELES